MNDIHDLIGQTPQIIQGAVAGSQMLGIKTANGLKYRMFHPQGSGEVTEIESVVETGQSIIGKVLTCVLQQEWENPNQAGQYKARMRFVLATKNGLMVIRWWTKSSGMTVEGGGLVGVVFQDVTEPSDAVSLVVQP